MQILLSPLPLPRPLPGSGHVGKGAAGHEGSGERVVVVGGGGGGGLDILKHSDKTSALVLLH